MKDVVDSYNAAFGVRSAVIAIDEHGGRDRTYPPEVVGRLVEDNHASYTATAEFINAFPCDAVSIQHEYGLFGGEEGEWIVDLIAGVRKPVIVSLHTVLPEPSPAHRRIARALCGAASAVVVLSQTGRDILVDTYGVNPAKIHVIHHGVPDVAFGSTASAKAQFGFERRTTISTFGLISRGKGLEYALEAMHAVIAHHPEVLYLILGQTHPVVRRDEGESYRRALEAKIERDGLKNNVKLVDKYLDFDELLAYLAASDIYLTPYLSPTQVVSGTLAYAVGCGKAIVSTPYLYAQELLAHGRGFLVPFRNARAIASTVVALLDNPELRETTQRRAYRFGRRMTWSHVANAYGSLFTDLLPAQRHEKLVTSV